MTGGMRDVAEPGLDEAVARLQAWVKDGDYQDPTPFADALGHLYVLENSHRRRLGDATYFTFRDADINGKVVAGIVYARGISSHLDVVVAAIEGRRPFTLGRSTLGGGDTLQGPGVKLVWRPFTELPAPQKRETHGRDALYRQRVEGREVIDTFKEVRSFFTAVKAQT
jgi:hypothetical protein